MPPTPAVPPTGHDFATYARTHWSGLTATARLLTDEPGAAHELARRTLERMCAQWRRVPCDDVDFHVRRCLVRGHLRRLRGRRSARRRAVLVLRVWEGRTDAEIAQLLGCSVGAVRAHARRGLEAAGGDVGRLREQYARAVGELTPSEVPLADVRARGRRQRRRRVAVTGAGCAVLLTAVAFLADGLVRGGGSGTEDSAGGAPAATSPVRVVAPGERVTTGPGVRVWLTADGGHWSGHSVIEGHRSSDEPLDDRPGVTLRVDSVKGGFLLSGLYYGLRGEPGRVSVRTGDRATTAKVLVLAGDPGWGIWYASAPVPFEDAKAVLSARPDERIVTVYDTSGKAVARSARDGGLI
ncbi:sigma factor-like helix-turn-helix DNA-binding protein [Streptomyces sp. AF1B]|uniref:sigma factor-like helix-turn-helix DNA-binding protein n=1 Tax=Streptomyces sp. AF1B TaxID=3399503 RepID=UPI003AABE3DC